MLKNSQSNPTIIVLSADKRNTTVVLDENDYNSKGNMFRQNKSYIHIAQDLTSNFKREINSLISSSSIPIEFHKSQGMRCLLKFKSNVSLNR